MAEKSDIQGASVDAMNFQAFHTLTECSSFGILIDSQMLPSVSLFWDR